MDEDTTERQTETQTTTTAQPETQTIVTPQPAAQQNRRVSKAAQIIWYIIGVIVAILLVRVVLALLGANLDNQFAGFIYAISDPFVAPFRGLLQVGEFQAGVSRFEVETLVAALVYVLIGWGLEKLIDLGRRP